VNIKTLKIEKTVSTKTVIDLLNQVSIDLTDIMDDIEALKVQSSTFYNGEEEKRIVLDKANRLYDTLADLYCRLEQEDDDNG